MRKRFLSWFFVFSIALSVFLCRDLAAAADSTVRITELKQPGQDYVLIRWTLDGEADGVLLYRADDGGERKLVKTAFGNSCYNYGLLNGSVYTYWIRPFRFDDEGNRHFGEFSAGESIQIGLKAAENLACYPYGDNAAQIFWNGDALATGHFLYRSTDGISWTLVKRVDGNETITYGLKDDGNYYFRVRSFCTIEGVVRYSDYSNAVSIRLGLPSPTGLQAIKAGRDFASLSWNETAGANAYRVYRSVDNGPFSLVKTVSGLSTCNYGLNMESSYRYKVAAIRDNGNGTVTRSADSCEVELLKTLPGVEIKSVLPFSGNGASIQWREAAGANAYRLYRESDEGDAVLVKTVATTSTNTFQLDKGEIYRFRIRPVLSAGPYVLNGELSEPYPYFHADRPELSVLSREQGKLLLQWDPVDGAESYAVFRLRDDGPEKIADTESCLLAVDDEEGWRYCAAAVRAGIMAEPSSPALPETLPPVGYVFSVCDAPSHLGVDLSWEPVANAAEYVLERSDIETIDWSIVAVTSGTCFHDGTTESGSSYLYRFHPVFVVDGMEFQGLDSDFEQIEVPEAPVYRALLIGEESYTETLRGPANDVDRMGALLSGMSKMNWSVYTQTDATKEELISLVSTAFSGAGENDISLFYYSGHGVTESMEYYSGALLTVDYSYIPMQELADMLSAIPGKVVVLLDGCGSGAAIVEQERPEEDLPLIQTDDEEAFSPEQFNAAVISAFSNCENGILTRSGALRDSKFYVITSSAFEENSRTIFQGGVWGGVFTRGLAESAGLSYSSMDWSETMAGDVDLNRILTLAECYQYCMEYASQVQSIQVFPQGSQFALFYK